MHYFAMFSSMVFVAVGSAIWAGVFIEGNEQAVWMTVIGFLISLLGSYISGYMMAYIRHGKFEEEDPSVEILKGMKDDYDKDLLDENLLEKVKAMQKESGEKVVSDWVDSLEVKIRKGI